MEASRSSCRRIEAGGIGDHATRDYPPQDGRGRLLNLGIRCRHIVPSAKTVGITGIAWALIGLCVILGSAGFGKSDSDPVVPILRWALWGAGLVMIFLFALQWNHYLHLNGTILREFDKAVTMGFFCVGLMRAILEAIAEVAQPW